MMLEILDPLTLQGYNEWSLEIGGSFFHSAHWAKVLHETYGYKPVYFGSLKGNTLVPFMEVSSPITGKRGVSLPFTDYCEPVLPDSAYPNEIMEEIIEFGRSSGWKYVELRGGRRLSQDYSPSFFFYGHDLDLARSEEEIFNRLRDSTKRNIRKAEKEGVEIITDTSLSGLKEFYRLNCMTRREHGLPPQPFNFFVKIHEHIISKAFGRIILASYRGENIAGAVFFSIGDRAFYKYGASDRHFQRLRANNLVMWNAICQYRRNGYKSLCFGRTEPENKGLLQFKKGWNAREHVINYYKYDLKMNMFIKGAPKIYGFHNRIFRSFPMPALKAAGSLLYRHMG